jgi:hypothetical protein
MYKVTYTGLIILDFELSQTFENIVVILVSFNNLLHYESKILLTCLDFKHALIQKILIIL